MSIATAITAAQGRVANAYTAISAKGGTLPQTQNLANMPAAINSIPSGGGGNIPNYQIVNGVLSRKTSTYNLMGSEFSGVTSIDISGLYFAFYNCTGLTGSVDLSSVTSIGNSGLNSAFRGTGVTNVNLSSVTSIGNSGLNTAFNNCTGLTGSLDLSSVTSIGSSGMSNAFYGCTGLTGSVDLSSVTSIGISGMSSAFQRCTGLTDLYFNSLTSSSFGSYTNQFNNMLSGVTGCKVHFPSNLQSVIGSWADVTNGFGGRNTTVLFDLESTE